MDRLHVKTHTFVKHGSEASRKPLVSALVIAGAFGPAFVDAESAALIWESGTLVEAVSDIATNVPGNVLNGGNVNTLIGADTFYDAGITGQNSVAANVEAGHIWNGHETLRHVAVFSDDGTIQNMDGKPATPEFDRHATWVGQMIGGRAGGTVQGPWQPGIAPGTDLRSGAIANSWHGPAYALGFSFTSSQLLTPYRAFFGTADTINSSWGFAGPTGFNFRWRKPLKMKEPGNRIFRFRSRNTPGRGVSGCQLDRACAALTPLGCGFSLPDRDP